MGLKNKINKMKSFLFDEVDEKENKTKTKEKKIIKQDIEEKKETKKKE